MLRKYEQIKILWQIWCLWRLFPNLRLCQLLNSVISEVNSHFRDTADPSFYIKDKEVLDGIREFRTDYV